MRTAKTAGRFNTRCMSLAMAMALLLLTMGQPAAGQYEPAAVSLRPQWESGQTSRYAVWSKRVRNTVMSMAGESRSQALTVETRGEVLWQVKQARPDGSASCTMTLDWIAATVSEDGGETQVNDSRQGQGDIEAVHEVLRAMAGVPISVEVAADGSVERVDGTAAIHRRTEYEAMVPEDLDFVETASDLATFALAPVDAQVGANWAAAFTWTHDLGFLHHDMSYTLAGVEELAGIPVATITGEGKLELEVDRSQIPDGGPPVDIRLVDGSVSTQVMYDLDRHEAVGRNTLQQTTIDVSVSLPDRSINQRVDETLQSQALRIAEE